MGPLSHNGGALKNGYAVIMRPQIAPLSLLPCEGTAWRSPSVNQEAVSHQTPNLWTPWSWTSRLQNYEENTFLLFKPPNLWYLVMAALLIPIPTLHDPGFFLYSRPQGAVKIAAHVRWICHTPSNRRDFCAPFLFLRFHIDFGPVIPYYLVISLMVLRSFVCFKIVSGSFSCFVWESLSEHLPPQISFAGTEVPFRGES